MSRAVAIALEVAAGLIDGAWCQHAEAARCGVCRARDPKCEAPCDWRAGDHVREFGPIGVGEGHPAAIAWSVEGALVRVVRQMGDLMPNAATAAEFGYGNRGDATLAAARAELARAIWPSGLNHLSAAREAVWADDGEGGASVAPGALMTWNDAPNRTAAHAIAALWTAAANAWAAYGGEQC